MIVGKWASVGVGVMIALLVQSGGAQVILTKTNSEGSYTTGNRLDLPNKLDLFSPITYDIPLLLDTDLYKNMSKYQDYKNNWIVDISNIDPKEFAPENPNYNIAVQRRGVPFIYLGKVFFILLLILLIARLFYGYLGGFRQKVKNLKGPEKRFGNKIFWSGIVIFMFFYIQYLGGIVYSSNLSIQYFTTSMYDYAKDAVRTANDTWVGIEAINDSKMPAYYSDLEFENFHIANRVESVLKESQDILKKSAGLKKEVENYDRRNLTRSLVILIGICILIAIVRYSFSKRKVFYSLITSLIFLCLAGYCCVLNGFLFNYTTVKIEMCQQSTEVIKMEKFPLYGMGVASIVTSFSNDAKTKMQEQIYEFNIAINAAFRMYLNRLKAMKEYKVYNKIYLAAANNTGGVWDLFFDYNRNARKDPILNNTFTTIKKIWRMYYDVETMLEGRFLKFWSYKYSNNICSFGIFVDVGCISLMFLCVIGLLVMAVGAWMNEYVIRCIIFEESRYINVEKYRYDWI